MNPRNVFVIGATGLIGGAVGRHLRIAGWEVSGLARSSASAERLRSSGIVPVPGDLDGQLDAVLAHVATCDAVIVAAQLEGPTELRLIERLIRHLRGRTLLFVSGSGVLLHRSNGQWNESTYAEDDPFPVEPLATDRRAAEMAVRAAADQGVRTLVVRAGMVWGPGTHGILAMIYASVAQLGVAGYVGAGRNVYADVHLDDLVRLIDTALEHGESGALYHAVGGETPTRWIAQEVARDLAVPIRSLTPVEAEKVWGSFGALIAGATSRISARRSRQELGWEPEYTDMLDDVGDPALQALARGVEGQ